MSRFRREIITEHIAAYEKKHDVTSYIINGKAVWPIIRITLSLTLHAGMLRPVQEVPENDHQSEAKQQGGFGISFLRMLGIFFHL